LIKARTIVTVICCCRCCFHCKKNANGSTTLGLCTLHRHLSNLDCLTVCTTCLVCFISTVNGRSQKKKPIKTGPSSGHITNLKQSILETFDIYAPLAMFLRQKCQLLQHPTVTLVLALATLGSMTQIGPFLLAKISK
jgi:hypothetical protein